jgi:hypothetical protein
MKVRLVRAELLHAGAWTDRQINVTKIRAAFHNFAVLKRNENSRYSRE